MDALKWAIKVYKYHGYYDLPSAKTSEQEDRLTAQCVNEYLHIVESADNIKFSDCERKKIENFVKKIYNGEIPLHKLDLRAVQ